jgi:hypothetical protein
VQREANDGFAAQSVQVKHRSLGLHRSQFGAGAPQFAADAGAGHQELHHEEQNGNAEGATHHPVQK